MRGCVLNRTAFGERFRGTGIFAEQLRQLFAVSLRRVGLSGSPPELATDKFRRPGASQLELGF